MLSQQHENDHQILEILLCLLKHLPLLMYHILRMQNDLQLQNIQYLWNYNDYNVVLIVLPYFKQYLRCLLINL